MQHCTAMPRGPGLLSLVFDAPVDRPNGSPVVALTPDALDACREMGLHPNVVDDLVDRHTIETTTWDRAREHFDEAQLLEAIALAGYYHTISFLCRGLDLPLESYAARFPSARA